MVQPDDIAKGERADPWSFAAFHLIWGHFGTEFMRRFRFPYFSATFVADPVERVLSNYLFWKEVDLSALPPELASQLAACRREPLARLLRDANPFIRAHLVDAQAKQFAAKSAVEPGALKLDHGDELLARAEDEARRFDFIGFRETLPASLNEFFAMLGAGTPPALALSEANASARSPENLAVRADADLRRQIRQSNQIDLALYEMLAARRSAASGCPGAGVAT